jgi:hypothetical protein
MIPRPEWRVLAYLLCWAAATWVVVQRMLSHSQEAYDGGDLSAFAWTGFFPFLFPLFMIEAGFSWFRLWCWSRSFCSAFGIGDDYDLARSNPIADPTG